MRRESYRTIHKRCRPKGRLEPSQAPRRVMRPAVSFARTCRGWPGASIVEEMRGVPELVNALGNVRETLTAPADYRPPSPATSGFTTPAWFRPVSYTHLTLPTKA